MVDHTSRRKRLAFAILAVVSAAGACGPTSWVHASTPDQPHEPDPVFAFLGSYDPAEVFRVVHRLRSDYVAECLDRRGFDGERIRREAFPVNQGDTSRIDYVFGGYVLAAIDAIEAGELLTLADEPAPVELSPAASNAAGECIKEAETKYPNPNDSLLRLLAEVEDDAADRVAADERVVEAAAVRDDCIDAVGFSAAGAESPEAALHDEANTLVSRYIGGSLSKGAALERLYALLPIEEAFAECNAPYAATLEHVTAEVWEDVLGDHPELVAEINEVLADEVGQYEPYLE